MEHPPENDKPRSEVRNAFFVARRARNTLSLKNHHHTLPTTHPSCLSTSCPSLFPRAPIRRPSPPSGRLPLMLWARRTPAIQVRIADFSALYCNIFLIYVWHVGAPMGMAPVTQVLFTRYAVTTVIRDSYVHPYGSWFAPIGSSMRTPRVPSGLTVIDSSFLTGQYHVLHYIHILIYFFS